MQMAAPLGGGHVVMVRACHGAVSNKGPASDGLPAHCCVMISDWRIMVSWPTVYAAISAAGDRDKEECGREWRWGRTDRESERGEGTGVRERVIDSINISRPPLGPGMTDALGRFGQK